MSDVGTSISASRTEGAGLGRALLRSFRRVAKTAVRLSIVAALFPLSLVLLALVFAADLAGTPYALLGRDRTPRRAAARRREVSFIIVSYNGRDLLAKCLRSVAKAIERDGGSHEIIVVDNGSADDTVTWLESDWPQVKVVALPENRFFGGGNRAGVAAATRDILVFLNNDMVVDAGFLGPLLDGFDDPSAFAVSAQIFFADAQRRREETGKTRGHWRAGELKLSHDQVTPADEARRCVPVFWAGGGSGAFDRRLFLELGEFEPLYDPFYMEDTGVSYQAWRRGWKVLFAPASQVIHEHRATGRRVFGDRYIDEMTRRNYYLFIWRNITGCNETLQHFLLLPQRFVKAARQRDYRLELRALGRSLLRLPQALWLRERDRCRYVRSDREVQRITNSYAEYDACFGRGHWRAEPLKILMLLARLPKRKTDGSWILYNLIRRLGEKHSITLLAFIDAEWEREHARDLEPYCEKIDLVLRRQNYGYPNLHSLVPRRLAVDYADPVMFERIRDYLEGGDFDIFQCEYLEMAHMLPDLRRLPSVFTHHEVLSLAMRRSVDQAPRKLEVLRCLYEAMLYLRYELKVCRRFRRIVALSNIDAEFLRSYVTDLPVHAIPSGVRLEDGDGGARGIVEEPIVVFVGYYLHPPNVEAALFLAREIFPRVREVMPSARCYLAGRCPTAEVQRLARDDPAVVVTGFVDDLARLLARASVVAIPIRTGAGLRGKFLEAWAHRKAVVATSVAAQGFEATPGQHFLVADNREDFANAIVSLLKDAHRRRELGEAGRALVERRYSDVAMALAYEQLYQELLEGAP
ncbi:MAG: glycosyltransferase [Planctomycetota bacterium]